MARDSFSTTLNTFTTLNLRDSPATMPSSHMPLCTNLMPIGTSLWTIPDVTDFSTVGSSHPVWVGLAVIGLNEVRKPTSFGTNVYACIQAGTAGAVEPFSADDVNGSVINDGTVKWKCYSIEIVRMAEIYANSQLFVLAATVGGLLYRIDSLGSDSLITRVAELTIFSNPRFAQWKNERALIVDANGYFDYDGTTLTKLSGTTGAPASGTAIAVWMGRVFISTGRTLLFSNPDSYTDFIPPVGANAVIDGYASLRSSIVELIAIQEYLYVIGDHSTHIAYGLQVLSDGTTAFNLVDSIDGVGTIYPDTIQVYRGSIYLVNDVGAFVISGANSIPFSDLLDTLFPKIDTSYSPRGFFAKVNNKMVYCTIVKTSIFDVATKTTTTKKQIYCFYVTGEQQRWFTVELNSDLDVVCGVISKTTAETRSFISYGNKVGKMFSATTSITPKTFRTKAEDYGTLIHDKQILRIGFSGEGFAPSASISPEISAIGSIGTGVVSLLFSPDEVIWVDNNNNVIPWTNDIGLEATWTDTWAELYAVKSLEESARGKKIQLQYKDTSVANYVINDLIVEGQYGARY